MRYGAPGAAPAGGSSTRNRNFGETRSASIAHRTPSSKPPPSSRPAA